MAGSPPGTPEGKQKKGRHALGASGGKAHLVEQKCVSHIGGAKKESHFMEHIQEKFKGLGRAISHMMDPHRHHGAPGEPAPGSPEYEEQQYNALREAALARDPSSSHKLQRFSALKSPDQKGHKTEMTLDRLKLFDVNGLVGKCKRMPITGQTYLEEVESFRDFALVDMFKRDHICGNPEALAVDGHLYMVKSMNMRTWIYHSKYRIALEKFQIGVGAEAFLCEALAERHVDLKVPIGLWSPAMIYAPLVPWTLLADDSSVFLFAAFCFGFCMITSVFTNNHTFYFWARPIMFFPRLAFFFFVLSRIQGGTIQLVGYLVTVFVCLWDFIKGDMTQAASMGYHCHYEVMRTLPNQVFVCLRVGAAVEMQSDEGRTFVPLPESITGIKDSGQGLCLLANVQGMLMELVPMGTEDGIRFKTEHMRRGIGKNLGNVSYFSLDILIEHAKHATDVAAGAAASALMTARLLKEHNDRKQNDWQIEDV